MDLLLILFAVGFLNKATYILPICLFVAAWKESLKVKIEGFENLLILGAFSLACYCSMFLIGGSNNLNLFLPPVAYCVGNMYHSRKSTPVRRIIFIFAYAMAGHVILNFAYELLTIGTSVFSTSMHIDIWSQTYSAATGAMINASVLASQAFGILLIEHKKHQWFCGCLVVGCIIYNLILGGRSFYGLLACGIATNLVGIIAFMKNKKLRKSAIARCVYGLLFLFLTGMFVWTLYADGIIQFWENSYFYHRFFSENAQANMMETGRWDIGKEFISRMWDYPWGGRQLHHAVHHYAHQLWLDVLDIGGILAFLLLIVYTVIASFKMLSFSFDSRNSDGERVMIFSFWLCTVMQFALEPIISAAPILFAAWCMVHGAIVHQESLRRSI